MLPIVEDLDGATQQINALIATNAKFADGGNALLGFIDAERARREYLAGAKKARGSEHRALVVDVHEGTARAG